MSFKLAGAGWSVVVLDADQAQALPVFTGTFTDAPPDGTGTTTGLTLYVQGRSDSNAASSRIRGFHKPIKGKRPDGTPYRAMDPELIGWVHTSIPWAVMRAFERYLESTAQIYAALDETHGAEQVPDIDTLTARLAAWLVDPAWTEFVDEQFVLFQDLLG